MATELLEQWQRQVAAGIRRMRDIGGVDADLDADTRAAALPRMRHGTSYGLRLRYSGE
ncbi:hypothetical protein PS467_37930 [Streptomyces luomodiensis]|uniref:Uncharacterized protein n=1 Tax=Streptomyces luomodiensis TaxID=3026192 RepID=A0ABY9V7E6_9ACTN|nr:hypothetical protein [Streptomyces sp. SCA4-21]WNF00704.1 hypothetical protein PS467_37930 [Streptomyces sp. SCA4-21]